MPVTHDRQGRLTLILGPMFAGKSKELIRRGLVARDLGEDIVALKPEIDDRYHGGRIVAHSGEWLPAIPVAAWPDLPEETTTLLLDEVQFFQGPWFRGMFPAHVADALDSGVNVIASGLSADWRGQEFPVVRSLLAMADEIVFLTAKCSICGKPAHHTAKLGGTTEKVQIGGRDLYEPRCRDHWRTHDRAMLSMGARQLEVHAGATWSLR
jgi:thymidine kinase